MSTYPDPARGEDLRTETWLSPDTFLVSYRAPGTRHPLRRAYEEVIAAGAPALARACLDMAASGEKADSEKAA